MSLWFSILLLAVIQGVTEFLPVSSSGHLAVLAAFCGFKGEESAMLGIMLHAGSLLAIIVFYWQLLLGFFRRDQFHLLCMVVLGSIPAGVVGILVKHFKLDSWLFGDIAIVAFGFLITGALLRLSGKQKLLEHETPPTAIKDISWKQSLVVGAVQSVAILPGISRSGSTIVAGLLAGIERESAAAFSFLLALPAIFGATLLETLDLLCGKAESSMTVSLAQLIVAVTISAVTSFGALHFLVNLVRKGKLNCFAWYVFALGILLILKYFARYAG